MPIRQQFERVLSAFAMRPPCIPHAEREFCLNTIAARVGSSDAAPIGGAPSARYVERPGTAMRATARAAMSAVTRGAMAPSPLRYARSPMQSAAMRSL